MRQSNTLPFRSGRSKPQKIRLDLIEDVKAIEDDSCESQDELKEEPERNTPAKRDLQYCIRSMGLSLFNSVVFTIVVTQFGMLGGVAGIWFLIGSSIGHGIGLLTIFQADGFE